MPEKICRVPSSPASSSKRSSLSEPSTKPHSTTRPTRRSSLEKSSIEIVEPALASDFAAGGTALVAGVAGVVFIANLAPRKMRFGVSEGMILSAGFDGGGLFLLDADSGAAPGMPVR